MTLVAQSPRGNVQQKLIRGAQNDEQPSNGIWAEKLRWDDLKSLLVVSETGSFRAAANQLGCSMNTLRNRVGNLERCVGAQLLERTVEGARLTTDGEEVVDVARQMRDASIAAERLVRTRNRKLTGEVRIGVTEGFGAFWLVPRMVAFQQQHPAITVDVRCEMTAPDVMRFKTHLAIQLVRPTHPELIVARLGYLHVMPFASEDYLRRKGIPVSLADYRSHHLVEQDADQIDVSLLNKVLPGPRPEGFVTIRTNTSTAHWNAIVHGAGIGMLPTYARGMDKRLRPVDLDGFRLRRDLWLAYHPSVKRLPSVQAAAAWIKQSFAAGDHPWFGEEFIHPIELEQRFKDTQVIDLFDGFLGRRGN